MKPNNLALRPLNWVLKRMEPFSCAGCHGYRAGVVPAVLLHQVLCEAFHGGEASSRLSLPQKRVDRKPGFVALPVAQRNEYLSSSCSAVLGGLGSPLYCRGFFSKWPFSQGARLLTAVLQLLETVVLGTNISVLHRLRFSTCQWPVFTWPPR